MIFKKGRLLRGLSVLLAFLCALFFCLELIATSSTDYKNMIDGIFGENSAVAGGADTYAFTSDFENTTQLYTNRAEIAAQIGEEGSVLLKNNGALPLRESPESTNEVKVTMLGSRAYTYKPNGELRDSTLAFYGGIVGSKTFEQTVTLESGKWKLPVTPQNALAKESIVVNPSGAQVYADKNFPNLVAGSEANGSQGAPFSINEPVVYASDFSGINVYNDACLVVIGRSSGEGREYLPGANGVADKSDGSKSALHLSDSERQLIVEANKISQNVIVLINSAVAMEIDDLKNDDGVDAVLWIGLPGSYGMLGVARVLSGKASPSGHLSDTYAVDASASPAAQNFGVTAQDNSGSFTWSNPGYYTKADNNHYVVLAEDMYTGYYYYETRYADSVEGSGDAASGIGKGRGATTDKWLYQDEVAYTFGYGLSYTTFTQEYVADENGNLLQYDAEKDTLTVQVKVKNTGDYPAKDVVQLYAQSPYTEYDKTHGVEKPAVQLLSFGKTKTLQPDEEETLAVTAHLKYLASYDKTAQHDGKTGGYILEDADYYFAIGNGAHEALNNVLVCKNAENASKLYLENGVEANADKAIVWNPAQESELTAKPNGGFNSGINVTLLSTSESGYAIENQLADANYNYFNPNTVTYLTRKDWSGSFPTAYTGLQVMDGMKKYLGTNENNGGRVYEFTSGGSSGVNFGVDHSEEEDENGQPLENMVLAQFKGAAYDDENWDYLLEQITFDEAWMFSPYGGTSCKPFKSVNAPEAFQIDGPNGNVTREVGNKAPTSGVMAVPKNDPNWAYKSADMACEPMTAATFNKELLEEQGKAYGEEGMWSRNPVMWAPGMNLHRTPFNSRNHEYYSEDPMLTNICGTAFVRGGVSKGMILSAKHFAFNTQESYREGLTQFMEEQSSRELELRAFQGLAEDVDFINAQGNEVQALGLMSSFSRIGVCGVNAHTGLMKNILRGEWGYKGLISTDMVVGGRFFNPQDSIINNVTFMATSNAENLLTNFWPDYNDKNKVRNDANLTKAIYENMHYYMYALANSSALNGYDANTVVTTDKKSGWEKLLIGLGITFGVLAAGAFVLHVVGALKNKPEDAGTEQK